MKKFLITMMLLVAVSALAADPQPTQNSKSNAAGTNEPVEVRGVPNISVNQAEIKKYGALEKSGDNEIGNHPASNPLMPEINRIQDQAMVRLNDLNSQLQNQSNEARSLELIREMESVKQEAELDIMRLQARAALARGDQETAVLINNAIEEMTTPRPPRQANERSAPASARN